MNSVRRIIRRDCENLITKEKENSSDYNILIEINGSIIGIFVVDEESFYSKQHIDKQTGIAIDRYKYLTIHFERFLLDQHVASVYSARKTNTRIIKSYRRREGSRKFTNGGGENSEDHGVRISRYLYSKNRMHRTERKELKIGLPDREIAHGFGSLAIYEQRFSVFSAG